MKLISPLISIGMVMWGIWILRGLIPAEPYVWVMVVLHAFNGGMALAKDDDKK